MKKTIKRISVALLGFSAMFVMASCERIDAGHEGIRVNLYGDEKGVGDVALVTGRGFYNPLTTEIHEYPTYVQTVDYEPFEINAKDGSKFTVDPTININPIGGKSPEIFKKYRKPLKEVITHVLKTHIANAYRIKLNAYTTDELVSKREEFEKATEDYLREILLKENFEQVPNELYLAAKVDGTKDIKYLWKVMMPICKPTIITITILKVIECWNSYVWPRLITDDENYFLVSNGIQEIFDCLMLQHNTPLHSTRGLPLWHIHSTTSLSPAKHHDRQQSDDNIV